MICIHGLLEAEDRCDCCGGDDPRAYSPICNGSGSPALYATELYATHSVFSIPLRFVREAGRTIVRHSIAPEQVMSPGAITLPRCDNRRINDLLNDPVYSSRLARRISICGKPYP